MSQPAPAQENIRTLAIRSSFVNLTASFGLKGLTLAQAIIYARVFAPGELGQVATVLLVIALLTVITRMGFEESVIRENHHPERILKRELGSRSFIQDSWKPVVASLVPERSSPGWRRPPSAPCSD